MWFGVMKFNINWIISCFVVKNIDDLFSLKIPFCNVEGATKASLGADDLTSIWKQRTDDPHPPSNLPTDGVADAGAGASISQEKEKFLIKELDVKWIVLKDVSETVSETNELSERCIIHL